MLTLVPDVIDRYAHDHTQSEGALLQELAEQTHATLPYPMMLTGRIEGQLLRMLVMLTGSKRVLEIGTYSGYSSLSMAEGLPEDGTLITCDIDPKVVEFARGYHARSPHGKKITVVLGPALETIARLEGSIDMVFIDADKENYHNYYEAVLPRVRPGGLIAVDNVLWSGRVLDPRESSDKAIAAFNEKLSKDERVDRVMLTVRDGVYLLRKR